MMKFRLTFATGVIVAAGAILPVPRAFAGDAARSSTVAKEASAELDVGGIKEKAEACQATPDERKFDQIGWATRILDAEKLAREHNRPVFLFTHDGRINTGRC